MAKRKDRSKIVDILKLTSSRKPYYFQVYLWSDLKHLREHFDIEPDDETLAMTCFEPWYVDQDTGSVYINPKLGEMHFARDNWSINIVAHEVQHAVIHRMRLIWPPAHLILLDDYADAEEEVAYETGHWVERTHRFLTKHDPHNKGGKLKLPVYLSPIRYPKSGLKLIKGAKANEA